MSGQRDYRDIASIFVPPGLSQAVGPIPDTTVFPITNTIELASFVLPGKWTLVSAPKVFGWQIQMGYGLSGAVITPMGDKLVVAKFKGEFWNNVDVSEFKSIRALLFQKPVISQGNQLLSGALGIKHPELAAMGVTGVVIGEYTPLIQEEGGLWSMTVDFIQYRPPVIAPPAPKYVVPPPTAAQSIQNSQAAIIAANDDKIALRKDALLGR